MTVHLKEGDEYANPYGDLEEPRVKTSTFAYDSENDSDNQEYGEKEAHVRLIDKKKASKKSSSSKAVGGKSTPALDSESDLAMAIVDILSCCDGSSNEAKILRNMESRVHESGSLIQNSHDEERRELFVDEYSKRKKNASMLSKISPSKWFRTSKSTNNPHKYMARSSSSLAGSMLSGARPSETAPAKSSSRKETIKKRLFYVILAVVLILILIVIVSVVKATAGKTGQGRHDVHHPNIIDNNSEPHADCSVIDDEEFPNVLTQCVCKGSITKISKEAIEKYQIFLQAFGAEYLHSDETMQSCSARNQALMWLAEDKGSNLSEALIQRHTLVLFFIKMNGLAWTLDEEHQHWLTADHECTWFGIACNENNQITAIELWNLNLDGSIPKELMGLTSLKRLSLPENRIHGHLPIDAFIMMSSLTDLTLFMNSISGSIDGQILKAVQKLETLNVDSNDMTGSIPTEIGLLSHLKEIKVARNYLTGTIPTELGKATPLTHLELEENNLVGTLPTELGLLYYLEYLDLSWNNLQDTSLPWEYQDLRNIQTLLLKSNDLKGTLPTIITMMTKLETLVLSLNAFTGELPSGMDRMSSLATLHLDGNSFSGSFPGSIGNCSQLREIRLDQNAFNGAIPTEIGKLEWLVSFSLEGNSFTGIMPEEVCKLRDGHSGILESLSATCAAETVQERNQEVFVRHNDFVCRVPDCCTSCQLRV